MGSLGRCRAEASREDVGMRRYVFSRSTYPGRARTGRISIGRSSAEGYREGSHSGRVAGALAGYAGRARRSVGFLGRSGTDTRLYSMSGDLR